MSDANKSKAQVAHEGPIQIKMREKLITAFAPIHIELENESHTHSVPVNSETHFRLVLVSAKFEGVSRVTRSRMVHDVVQAELSGGGVHALTQRNLTESEWRAQGADSFVSPDCHGGSKAESKK
jgi:stress-induced morphogen